MAEVTKEYVVVSGISEGGGGVIVRTLCLNPGLHIVGIRKGEGREGRRLVRHSVIEVKESERSEQTTLPQSKWQDE